MTHRYANIITHLEKVSNKNQLFFTENVWSKNIFSKSTFFTHSILTRALGLKILFNLVYWKLVSSSVKTFQYPFNLFYCRLCPSTNSFKADLLVLEWVKNLKKIESKNRLILQWIKAHVGHLGKEEVDIQAKAGADMAAAVTTGECWPWLTTAVPPHCVRWASTPWLCLIQTRHT